MSGRPQVCDRCRWKKIKCDGNAQACANCAAAGLQCHTTQKLSKRSSPKSYVQSMEARLQELETELAATKRECEALRRKGPSLNPQPEDRATSKIISDSNSSSVLDQRVENTKTNPVDGPGNDDPIVREVGRMVNTSDGTGRFMGSSSGIFLLGTAFGSYQASVGSHSSNFKPHLDDLFALDAPSRYPQLFVRGFLTPTAMVFDLPSRDVSTRLASSFFENAHAVFPVLHKPSFLECVRDLYAEPSLRSSLLFLPQFYIVLAIGERYESLMTGDASFTTISPFVQRYHAAKDHETCAGGPDDLQVVQTLTLETLLLDLYGERTRAMQVIAKAARLALSLGMHRHSRRFSYGPLVAAMRIRVFWCIYMLDMFTASLAGIPKFLRDYDIDVEEPFDVDDEDTTPSNFLTGLPGERTQISGFISICKLSKIMSQILETLYTTTDRRRSVAKMTSMQRLLNQWQDTHLGYPFGPSTTSSGSTENGQGPLLIETYEQLLYHYTRWLLYRPALSFLTSSPRYKRSLSICTEASSAMITTAHRQPKILPLIPFNPGAHSFSLWSAGVTALFQHWDLRSRKDTTAEHLDRVQSETRASCENCTTVLRTLSTSEQPGAQDRVLNMEELLRTTFSTTSNIPSPSTHTSNASTITTTALTLKRARSPPSEPNTHTHTPIPPLPPLPEEDMEIQPPSSFLDANLDLDLAATDFFSGEWFPLGFSPEKIQAETFDLMQVAGFEYGYEDEGHGVKRQRLE